jgi:uncharacterized protein YwgA
MKLTGKKLLLLLLYTPTDRDNYNEPIVGRTRLMKMVFLFREEILSDFRKDKTFDEIDLPEYIPWKYGPFSVSLLNDLEFLKNQRFIQVRISTNAPIAAELAEYEYWIEDIDEFAAREYDEEVFELGNETGIPKARELWNTLSENQKKMISKFKAVLNRAPLDKILEYVYKKYGERGYVDRSLIREKYLS